MATHAHTTITTPALWPDLFGPIADIPRLHPTGRGSAHPLRDFRCLNAALAAIPDTDEPELEAAREAHQVVAERLMIMRPATEAGRREKAAVGFAIMNEVAAWERDSEWQFAAAAF